MVFTFIGAGLIFYGGYLVGRVNDLLEEKSNKSIDFDVIRRVK